MAGRATKSPSATFHLHAVLLHGAKVRTTREQGDIEPALRHARADVGSDRARSGNQKSHPRITQRGRRRPRAGEFFPSKWLVCFSPDIFSSDICIPPNDSRQCLISSDSVGSL